MINITKKLLWSLSSFSFRLLSNVFVYIIIARDFGPEKFGEFSLYILIGSIISLISDFGTHQRLFQYLSTEENSNNINTLYGIKFILILMCTFFIILLSIIKNDISFFLVSFSFIFNLMFDWLLIYFRASSKFKKEAKYAFINNILFFMSIVLILSLSTNMVYLSLTMMLVKLSMFLFLLLTNKDIYIHKIKIIKIKDIREHIYYGFDFIFVNIWVFLDGLFVKYFFSVFYFGLYSSYTRLTNGIGSLSGIITNVIFSRIAQDAKKKKFKNLIIFSLLFLFLSVITLIVIFFFGENIVNILLGEKYIYFNNLLFLLMLPVTIKWVSSPVGIYLFSLGYVKLRVFIQALSIILFLTSFYLLNSYSNSIVWIPISMSISYFVVLVLYFSIAIGKKNES